MRRSVLIILLIILLVILLGLFRFSGNGKQGDHLILYGNVDVRQVDLGFRVSGRVKEMFFQEGDLVPEGKLMAVLDKQPYMDLVLQAEAAEASAKASLENAERQLKRRQELGSDADGSISIEELENAFYARNLYAANTKQSVASLGVAKS